jgi:two-component system, LytTR family, response regulator AlgR
MTLKVLLVDDEALARSRLKTLLGDCKQPATLLQGEAANAADAMELLKRTPVDVVLLDINLPGANGISLARVLRDSPNPPAIVFITAYSEHAVQAFELEAIDYLTKPVRLERLQAALQKVERARASAPDARVEVVEDVVIIQERGHTERLPLSEVMYFKAELKYITVRTARRSYILDGSINELEEKYKAQFMRIHRNAIIARRAVRALVKHVDPQEGEGWAVRLADVPELLFVSRRQVGAVREAIGG